MKRFLVLCIAVIVCYAAVTGSIAYFTDSVETVNRVASGNLHVVQHEYERVTKNGETEVQAFQQEKPLYPAVKMTSGEATETVKMPNGPEVALTANIRNYVDKIVTAENTGSLNMYVRTYIAVPSFAKDVAKEPWIKLEVNTATYGEKGEDCWSAVQPILDHVEIDEHYYDIYMTTYSGMIEPNGTTPPSLLGFYMDSKVTNDGEGLIFTDESVTPSKTYHLGNGSNMKILVATVASQASVFADADKAMAATYPKDKETDKEIYHPWDKTFFATTQDELNAALNTAQTEYDTVIPFAIATKGNYTIPAQLPEGLRITGAGADVTLTIDNGTALSANDVEFDHVTFNHAFTFTGWGSFEEVTFAKGTEIKATHDTVLVDCVNPPAALTNVTIVNSAATTSTTTTDTH